jgi:hypothetical protein
MQEFHIIQQFCIYLYGFMILLIKDVRIIGGLLGIGKIGYFLGKRF